MSGNLLIGSGVMAVCVIIQCVAVAILLQFFHRHTNQQHFVASIPRAAGLLAMAVLIMFFGNLVQMAVWAWVFVGFGEFDLYATAFYHSAVNFSTLGYGDIVMSEKRRLLGAIEASNGVLMFGLTTSALISLVQSLSQRFKQAAERKLDSKSG